MTWPPPPLTLQDLRGHLYPFCRDQHGSRLVQQQLEVAEPELVMGARGGGAPKGYQA